MEQYNVYTWWDKREKSQHLNELTFSSYIEPTERAGKNTEMAAKKLWAKARMRGGVSRRQAGREGCACALIVAKTQLQGSPRGGASSPRKERERARKRV